MRAPAALMASALLFALNVAGREGKAEPQPEDQAKNIQLKSASACIGFYGGGNATQLFISNSCSTSREFDVQWSDGPVPPIITKYRINQGPGCCYVRIIDRQANFLTAAILSDSPSTLGLGSAVNVTVQTKPLAGGGGQTGVFIINTTGHHTYVEYVITIKHANGKTDTAKSATGYELDPVGTPGDGSHIPITLLFTGDNYVVQKIIAKTDND